MTSSDSKRILKHRDRNSHQPRKTQQAIVRHTHIEKCSSAAVYIHVAFYLTCNTFLRKLEYRSLTKVLEKWRTMHRKAFHLPADHPPHYEGNTSILFPYPAPDRYMVTGTPQHTAFPIVS